MADAVRGESGRSSAEVAEALRGTEGLFARQSSGLVREIGLRGAFGIAAGILVPMGMFVVYAIFLQLLPGVDFYIPLIAGFVLAMLLAVSYAQLVSAFPRSGGEYIWGSRVFTPLLGAMVGGAVLVALMLNAANTVVQESQIFLPFFFSAIGDAFGSVGLGDFGGDIATKTPAFLTSVALILLYGWLASRPVENVTRYVFWTFLVGMLAWFTIVALIVFNSHSDFIAAFNDSSRNSNAYDQILSGATQSGFSPGIVGAAVVAAIPVGVLIYVGFSFNNYAGGELRRPGRTYLVATILAGVFGLALGLLSWAALRKTVGLDFMQSQAHLAVNEPDRYEEITSVAPLQGAMAYALALSGDPITKLLIGVGVPLAFFANGLAYMLLASRVVFALSFDRLLPTRMAEVREKTHSPVYAVGLVMVGVLAFSALGDYTSLLTLFRNLVLVVIVIFIIGSVAAALLPFRRRELYERSPKILRRRWFGVPAIIVIATLSAVGNAAAAFLIATKPEISGGYSWDSVLTLALVATVGLFAWVISRSYLRRRGVDLDLAMRELPPE